MTCSDAAPCDNEAEEDELPAALSLPLLLLLLLPIPLLRGPRVGLGILAGMLSGLLK